MNGSYSPATQLLGTALQYHQAGNLQQAEQIYRQILQSDPYFADAHHLLGLIAYQTGHHESAVASIRHALSLQPNIPIYYSNLGVAYEALGQVKEALACFQQALRLQPHSPEFNNAMANALRCVGDHAQAEVHGKQALALRPHFPEAHNNLANVYYELGRRDEAVVHYRQAVQLKPDFVDALNNLGLALAGQGKLDEAIAQHQQALRIRPDSASAYNSIGNALREQGRLDEAIQYHRHALQISPRFADAHNSLGVALKRQGKLDEAIQCYHEALRLAPSSAEACNNLGNALERQDKLEESAHWCQQALHIRPNFAEAYNSLGIAHLGLGRLDDAMTEYQEALRIQSNYAEARWNRSLLLLLRGDFAQGWPEYEWRKKQAGAPIRSFAQPEWDGAYPQGRTILVYAEQGLGDTLQFVRYCKLLKDRGAKVIFECQPALARLFGDVEGIDELVVQGSPLPPFDRHVALLSLPHKFHTSVDTIPAIVPYLHADAALVDKWRQVLSGVGDLASGVAANDTRRQTPDARRFLVAIAWQGTPTFRFDRQRSIPLARFGPLASVPGVQLVSVQTGHGTDQLQGIAGKFNVLDLGQRFDANSLSDCAAVLKGVDLVITVDTAIAHLAGGLGVPVWLALPFVPDWRWLLQREDSPWYPTMRLFRQHRRDDWDDVFQRMVDLLQETKDE